MRLVASKNDCDSQLELAGVGLLRSLTGLVRAVTAAVSVLSAGLAIRLAR